MTLRAKEVDYDKEMIKTVKQPWYAYKFVKYKVKSNSYGIEEIWDSYKEVMAMYGEAMTMTRSI